MERISKEISKTAYSFSALETKGRKAAKVRHDLLPPVINVSKMFKILESQIQEKIDAL